MKGRGEAVEYDFGNQFDECLKLSLFDCCSEGLLWYAEMAMLYQQSQEIRCKVFIIGLSEYRKRGKKRF